MTWQDSQLRPGGRAPADAGGQMPRKVPSIQSSWLPPSGTRVPEAEAIAAADPHGTSWALPLTLSGPARPAAPAAARAPPGPAARTAQRAGGRPPPPTLPRSGWAIGRPRQRERRLPGRQRQGRNAPACLARPPPATRRPQFPQPLPDPIPLRAPPLGTGPAESRGEAVVRRGRRGGGGRHHVCPPLPEAGCQRTKRGGGAGGAGTQAHPADPRGISGARSPGNPAP